MAERYEERRKKLQQAVRGKADGILVSGVSNVTWLTGFTGDASCLMLTKSRAVLVSDSRFDTQIEEECPGVEKHIRDRLTRLFIPDDTGARPCHGGETRFAQDPHWKSLVLFHEHFHADIGRGLGATHQTGWTALVGLMLGCRGRTPATPPVRRRDREALPA